MHCELLADTRRQLRVQSIGEKGLCLTASERVTLLGAISFQTFRGIAPRKATLSRVIRSDPFLLSDCTLNSRLVAFYVRFPHKPLPDVYWSRDIQNRWTKKHYRPPSRGPEYVPNPGGLPSGTPGAKVTW